MQTHGTDRRENCRELSWKGRMSMLAKYVLCILTIEWAVLGMRLLKGKGRSYERIRNDDRIREKEQFVRFQGMNLLYLALVTFLTLLTTFAGSDRLTIRFFELTALDGCCMEIGNTAGRSGSGGDNITETMHPKESSVGRFLQV